MAIAVFDDFNRADASGLGTASTGQVWSIETGPTNWSVNGNNALWTWNFGDPTSIAVVESGLTDGGICRVTLVNPSANTQIFGIGFGVNVRWVDVNFYWRLVYYRFPGPQNRLRLQRVYAGATTTVIDTLVTVPDGGEIAVAWCGDDWETFVDGVSQGTYDASTNPQNYGSKCGLYASPGTYFGLIEKRFDDFTVETNGTCTPTYNCTPSGCVDPGDGSGTFATLSACLTSCEIAVSYNCVDGVCVDPGDGSGEFATLEECQQAPCGGTIADSIKTARFDAGSGSAYYLVPPVTDSGDELRSKQLKSMRSTGRRTNVSMKAYGYDVNSEVSAADLESGENASTRAQALPDTTHVAQSPRKQINVPNAVLSTVRLEGDDTGQDERDEIHEIVVEVAQQGVRR